MLPTTASTGPKYLRTIARGMSSGARSLLANFRRSQPTTSILSTRFLFADQCRQHLSSPKPCDSTQALQIHNTKLPLEQEIYRRFTNTYLPVENMSLAPAAFVADMAGTVVPCCCYFASIARPSSGKRIHARDRYNKTPSHELLQLLFSSFALNESAFLITVSPIPISHAIVSFTNVFAVHQ